MGCDVDADTPIQADTPCLQCGYNLRALAVTARCPECGYPALRGVLRAAVVAEGRARDGVHIVRRATELVARLLRRNVDSVRFVRRACLAAIEREPDATSNAGVPRAAGARAVCERLRDLALEHYLSREEATATFRFWRIDRSEDVGEIVFALVEIGLLAASKDDSRDDFNGLFTIGELFSPDRSPPRA
jgi:uncharacterized repeat protein (TIGR04138 family)